MPRPTLKETRSQRWLEIEASRGIKMEALLPALFEQLGGRENVAESLGVNPNTLDSWVELCGYRYEVSVKTRLVPAVKVTEDDGEPE